MSTSPRKKRVRLYLVVAILVTVVVVVSASLEYYAISTNLNHMVVVSQDAALKSVRYYHNATYMFSSGDTRWLLVTQLNIIGVSSYYVATMYIFKIAGTDGRDLKFLGTDTKYNGTSVVDSLIFGTYYYSNSTVVTIGIHFAAVGTYIVDFGLQLQVYSTVLFLPIAQEQIRVATDLLVHYGT